ncbi:putative pentatricopeptide repeat-containing protein At5g09950 [Asparagus officinalis]|uniref:putative pentatricopeptide repeat-containing protein At5g09950 n=1 Tax=Asparagus officinalis TaxID=4686 RepID=UPI00098DFB07|nr:putative pentatricopeptide repeat-containing protein At5g09950 [Asparagus officinalis]
MVSDGCLPTHFTLAAALRACQDCAPDRFGFGVQVHGLLAKTQHASDTVVCNALISMYGSCCLESSSYAHCVFDEMLTKNLISWNSIIGVDSRRGDVASAFELFSEMQAEGFEPSEHTFGSLIISTYDCGPGNFILDQLLARVSKNGFLSNLYVGSALVSAFARFGVFYKARGVFVQMSEKNAVSMNGLIVGLVKQNQGEEAVEVFRETGDSIEINSDSYVVLLSAISEFKVPEEGRRMGREVHGFLIRTGLIGIKVAIENGLVNMYAKCCAIEEACWIFEHMRVRDQISWSSIISGLDQNGIFEEALLRFGDMLRTGIVPSKFTLISSLSSSAGLGLLSSGTQVHAVAMKFGLDLDVSVANSLLKLYGECGSNLDCWKVFNSMSDYDLVSWNSMIGLLAKSEESLDRSVGVFLDMMRRGWTPNKVTLINVLSALSPLSVLELGKQVHALVLKRSISDNNTIDNALISCYAKSGDMDSSEQIFTRMYNRRDGMSWNSMLAGYVQNGLLSKAMDFLWFMMQNDQNMDSFTFATVISACASIATLNRGMEIHAFRLRSQLESDVVVDSALVDMYSKCGRIDYASKAFRLMPVKNEFSWNSMISGYARHGHGEKALELFKEMQRTKQKPDHVTFVGVLHACSHSGLVEKGLEYFESMSKNYGLVPRMEHYSCVVDILGRAGELNKMEDFIRRMPMSPNILIWRTVLVACCRSKDGAKSNLGEKASQMLVELEPQNPVNYILSSNLYALRGSWENVAKSRAAMRGVTTKKEAGCSWVNLRDGVHVFMAGDRLHSDTEEIYAKLRLLNQKMKDLGYVPKTDFALYDLEVENKEELLSYHSEKLAVAFVLTRSSGRMPIRIMKNLRVCGDCHSAFGYISKIVERQIILRDSNRFHHFEDGKCSCGDY